MTERQEKYLVDCLAQGKKLVWMGDTARVITKIGPRKDEEGMLCGYVDGGKPGDYIALWNVEPGEVIVGEFLNELCEEPPGCKHCKDNDRVFQKEVEYDYHEYKMIWFCGECKKKVCDVK